MSETGIPGMGDIYQLGHAVVKEIFDSPVEITEKVDGSFFSFQMGVDGELRMRSKGTALFSDAPSAKMFGEAMRQVEHRKDALTPGWIYRGEMMMKPKHNSLAYDRIPQGNVAIFDIEPELGSHLEAKERDAETARLSFSAVPVLYQGMVPANESGLTILHSFLERDSFLGGQKIEGIVIKNYNQHIHGHMMMCKLVSAAFKEKHATEWKNANPGNKDVIERIIEIYKHENRWRKSIQHLRDEGLLIGGPQDIGPLMKEISSDVLKEEEDSIKEALWKYAWPQISRGVTRGFPDFYKEELAKEQFDVSTEED